MSHSGKKTLLVIDDEKIFCDTVRDYLENGSLEVLIAHNGADGMKLCTVRKVDVVLLDQKLPDGEGHSLASAILEQNEQTKIIFITAFPSFENAVTAVRLGAHDYLSKPFDPAEMKLTVDNALRTLDLEKVEQLQNYTREKERKESVLIGNSAALAEVRRIAESAAAIDAPVMITGETGTGKNLLAKTIHYRSALAKAPFISINCSTLPENLIESELFGHEKGAFTGAAGAKKGLIEMADGGTLFLDEIGEMPFHLQSKLLSVIEEQLMRRLGGTAVLPVSIRIIAATNTELEQALGKTFRKDLYYRLSVIRIHIPPLREHPEDITALCDHLLVQHSRVRTMRLAAGEAEKLMAYNWPGNVRELKNILERAVFLQKGEDLRPSLLLDNFGHAATQVSAAGASPSALPGGLRTIAQAEKELIQLALSELSGNLTQSAKALGISLSTLKRKVQEYRLK